jgi:hypothetical protein
MREAILRVVGVEELERLVRELYECAVRGDVAAAQLILRYVVGKPGNAVDPDRVDLDEWAVANAAPTRAEALFVLLDGLDPGAMAELARRLCPAEPGAAREKLFEGARSRDCILAVAEAQKRRAARLPK